MRILDNIKNIFSKNNENVSVDEFYANDPAYQDFNKEHLEHCRNSGLKGNERTLIANLVSNSYYAFKEGKAKEQLLPELEDKLQALIKNRKDHATWLKMYDLERWKEENPDLTAVPAELAVLKIILAGESLIYYWKEPYFSDGIPLLKDCLTDYFNNLSFKAKKT